MPRLLHDILRQLLADVDEVELVDPPATNAGIVETAAQTHADLVIATEADAGPREATSLLARMPTTRALAVSHDGRSGVVYELRPVRRPLGELSAATLRQVVRATTPSFEQLLAEPTPRPAP
jgi:hypothetical protein